MHSTALTIGLCLIAVLGARTLGQGTSAVQTAETDWSSHNRDVRNTRYSPLNQIDASNVNRLAIRWSFQAPGAINISATTPLVVQGVM